ncbi:adenosylhomocysteinase [Candidatus Korarchaeum cryptofilum]|uniref:Adenosylhomocysteinase n=1 Tax=Candidatus Korarchaeum cryptofilum TaxID=498846 RepID=A0A429G5G0_9CREN|nr:adenosylhomocysteinase [Candidatus Korarchaeum cryptofilum]RSN69042.1 adenosylhomocysteinase [Candidatus Korarchaeum cryptofilum]
MPKVKDEGLAGKGKDSIEWARAHMPVLSEIARRFLKERPLDGLRIAASMHVTKETAVLMLALRDGGARIFLSPSNPLSTQDDVAAALAEEGIEVYAWRGMSESEYFWAIEECLKADPDFTMDDGGDLTVMAHEKGYAERIAGGTEETTTGVLRLMALERDGKLRYPVIAVNDAETKRNFDNVYGTGQSTIDGILRATNIMIAGKWFVVAGYGYVGRGIANRARGMGAKVIVTEVDPIRALMAAMDGFIVMPMREAAKLGDIFVTATGNSGVIKAEHVSSMKDGAILANAGHFDVEVSVKDLELMSLAKRDLRENLREYLLPNGKRVYLLAEGRLVNLVAAEGHPSEVMDMSFANQALSIEYLVKERGKLPAKVIPVPRWIDSEVARIKLRSMGIEIDSLTKEQEEYLRSWRI